jgi:MscS family membrane protein
MHKALSLLSPYFSYLGDNIYLQAAFIALASIITAKLGDIIICRIVGYYASKTKTDLDNRFIDILHRPLFLTIILAGFAVAASRLPLPGKLVFMVTAILGTTGVIVWLGFGIKLTNLILIFLSRQRVAANLIQPSTLPLFKNLTIMILTGGAIYFIFIFWHIDVTAWLASAGIVGIALGFAAKDTLANLFAGVFILVDAPYKIGDYILLDSGERGMVTHIGVRSTRILTRDDVEITIPNAIMGNSKIINESGGPHPKFRIRAQVGVSYSSDVEKVRNILMTIARENTEVCEDPEPRVRFRTFGDSSLNFELLCWVSEPSLRGKVLDSLNMQILTKFRENKVEIPFPQRDVNMKKEKI